MISVITQPLPCLNVKKKLSDWRREDIRGLQVRPSRQKPAQRTSRLQAWSDWQPSQRGPTVVKTGWLLLIWVCPPAVLTANPSPDPHPGRGLKVPAGLFCTIFGYYFHILCDFFKNAAFKQWLQSGHIRMGKPKIPSATGTAAGFPAMLLLLKYKQVTPSLASFDGSPTLWQEFGLGR